MKELLVPLLFAVAIAVMEYVSKSLDLRHKSYYYRIVSFTAGVSTSYILLELFPIFSEKAIQLDRFLFLFLLVGFISHHIVEKEIYKHNRKHELVRMLTYEEHIFYYIYHFIFGIVLVTLTMLNPVEGTFFAISIFAYTLVSNLPSDPHKSKKRMIFLSTSTIFGAILAAFIWPYITEWALYAMIGLITGVLLFTVTRHHIPHGRVGNVTYFILGFLLYGALIVIKWTQ